jgi:hypothetical protein
MGSLNIIFGGLILIVFLLVFMQPVIILVDTASDVLNSSNTTKYGTDSDGVVVEVGDSFFGVDLIVGLISAIGLAFVVGFIIWAGRGGRDPTEDLMMQGGFRQ